MRDVIFNEDRACRDKPLFLIERFQAVLGCDPDRTPRPDLLRANDALTHQEPAQRARRLGLVTTRPIAGSSYLRPGSTMRR